MKSLNLSCLVAVLGLGVAPFAAHGQASAPAPALAASAPALPKPPPRLATPQERRDSAAAAGDLRPEQRVQPQFNLPLGKPHQPLERPRLLRRAAAPASSGGIDDAAARCEAEADAQRRAECRAGARATK